MNPSNTLMSSIDSLLNSIFSSIDNTIYSALDEITFVDNNILSSKYFEKLFGTSTTFGILMIANSLLIGFILYYTARYLLSNYSPSVRSQNPFQFILRLIFIGIFMNSSFYICEQIININSLFSSAIRELGSEFLNANICFSNLINILNSVVMLEEVSKSFFSIDGIIKSVVSIGFINLVFIYSIRYILIKVFVLISPFAILCNATESTAPLFKSWLKSFISMLLLEIFSSIILIVMFSIDYSPYNLVSKLLFVGAIFALMKANGYIKELIGGIGLDIQNSLYALRNYSKIR